ncbi:MAG: DUF502 domain-containing protein [Gammaproteobacteria bacterium]|nr:DUF502 domain-containing protein [Gammaproteobacteria bacterium]
MKSLSKIFLSGLAAILPMAITIYILFWLGSGAENRLGGFIQLIIPAEYYWTGMGLIAGLIIVFAVGLLLNALVIRNLFVWGEAWLAKVPLVKTLYGSIRDLMKFVSNSKGKQMGQVVTVKIGEPDILVLGFLTNENVSFIDKTLRPDLVAVYLPLSYQIGGHTVLVPRSSVKLAELPMNEAMRFAITAGMVTGEHKEPPKHPPG